MGPVPGLKNLGHTCFFNAVLQALASCELLTQALERALDVCGGDGGGADAAELSAALLTLLRGLGPDEASEAGATRHSLSPLPVLQPLRSCLPSAVLRPGHEHDAAEALELLLQAVSSELRLAFKCSAEYPRRMAVASLDTVLSRPTEGDAVLQGWRAARLTSEGLVASDMRCLRCTRRFAAPHVPCHLLQLGVPTAAQQRGGQQLGFLRAAPGVALVDCLGAFLGFELLHGVNCDGCSAKASLDSVVDAGGKLPAALAPLYRSLSAGAPAPAGDALESRIRGAGVAWVPRPGTVTKRSVIARWPPTLLLHLRRTVWSPSGQQVKICGRVAFPMLMAFQAAGAGKGGSGGSSPRGGGAGSSGGGGGSGSPPQQKPGQQQQQQRYLLRAVVEHTGLSPDTGHYVAYRRLDDGAPHESGLEGPRTAAELAASSCWVRVSDQAVEEVGEEVVLKVHATLLFYEAR